MGELQPTKPAIALDAVVLECPDAESLADFYLRMLGWQRHYGEPGEWVDIQSPDGGVKIAFQQNDAYEPPTWPDEPGKQQQMAHLDFAVADAEALTAAVRHAQQCGAVRARVQHSPTQWITLIDPAGHPFCFVLWP